MGMGELTHGHRASAGQLFDVVVRSGHHAVLVIIHRTPEALHDVRGIPIEAIDFGVSSIGRS